MIDIGKIIKRAWHILWNYRILWIFGVLLAITSGSGSSGNSGSGSGSSSTNTNGGNINWNSSPFLKQLYDWFQTNIEPLILHPADHIATFVWIGIGLLLFFLIVGVIFALIRYPSETAVIRMVDEYERTGVKVGFRQGWRLGWTRRAFRIWVIDLIVSLPVLLLLAVLGGLGFLAFLGARGGHGAAVAASLIAAIGCAFLFILAFIILPSCLAFCASSSSGRRHWKRPALVNHSEPVGTCSSATGRAPA
jgi:hypothetical protein